MKSGVPLFGQKKHAFDVKKWIRSVGGVVGQDAAVDTHPSVSGAVRKVPSPLGFALRTISDHTCCSMYSRSRAYPVSRTATCRGSNGFS